MAKEELIKGVCGEYYEHYLKKSDPIVLIEMRNLGILDKIDEINHNNGWIRIESEADLPKEQRDYLVGKMIGEKFYQSNGMYDKKEVKKSYLEDKITHYQPIEKPKPPIY